MIDLIFIVVVIASFVAFIVISRKFTKSGNKRKKRKNKNVDKQDKHEIPKSWRKDNPSLNPGSGHFKVPKPTVGKIHVPGLRTAWRVLIGLLLVTNFFIAQAMLLSASQMQSIFWLFFLNSAALMWALWKTRR